METITYYRHHNTDVYVLLLNASQAFDKVNYVKLFKLLLSRNINPIVIRCILYMYTNQNLNIKWNNLISKYLSTSNGVKQREVISPILFRVYIYGPHCTFVVNEVLHIITTITLVYILLC